MSYHTTMPPVISCDNCGLTYYQTTAPHVCAEWVGGVGKSAREQGPPLTTSHGSRECALPGCPCHEWAKLSPTQGEGGESEQLKRSLTFLGERLEAQAETLAKVAGERNRLLEAARLLLAMNNCNYDRDQMRRSGGFDALGKAVEVIQPNWRQNNEQGK